MMDTQLVTYLIVHLCSVFHCKGSSVWVCISKESVSWGKGVVDSLGQDNNGAQKIWVHQWAYIYV